MRRVIRFVDWRLFLSITVLLIVAAAIQSSLATAHDRDRLAAEAAQKDRVASIERKNAAAERQRLLEGQRRLELKYDALLSQQARLVSWLNGRGIVVPQSVLDARSGSDNDDSDGDGSVTSSTGTGRSGKQSPPKSGSPSGPFAHAPGGSRKGHGAGGRHDKKHGSSSSSRGSHSKAKAKGHKDR